jgi:hypothetical protein
MRGNPNYLKGGNGFKGVRQAIVRVTEPDGSDGVMSKTIGLRVSDATFDWLEQKARSQDMTKNDILREMISLYMNSQQD